MKTRTSKTLGAAAGIAAIVASLPLAITANADDPTPAPTTPVTPIPDPQGSGCDAFKTALPNWKGFNSQPVGTVLASIPDISTFNSLVSGQANPAVNIVAGTRRTARTWCSRRPTTRSRRWSPASSTPSRPTPPRCTSSTTTTSSSACSAPMT